MASVWPSLAAAVNAATSVDSNLSLVLCVPASGLTVSTWPCLAAYLIYSLIAAYPALSGRTQEADPAADDHGPAQEAEPAEPLDGDLLSAAHNQSKHHDLCGGAESRLGGGEAALLRASGSLLEQLGIYVVESPDLAREGGRGVRE